MKSPAKQEMEGMQDRALASVADALENKRASTKEDGTGLTPSDGECRRGEKFAIHMEVEKN